MFSPSRSQVGATQLTVYNMPPDATNTATTNGGIDPSGAATGNTSFSVSMP